MNRLRRIAAVKHRAELGHCVADSIPGLESALSYFQTQERVDLIEVEESFGLPDCVVRHASVPVVARLHGPWFLNGAANGYKPNEEFVARVRAEGEAIVNARYVSSPSHFVLRAVEERYQVSFPLGAVIPNSVEPVAESSVWNPVTADPDHVLFVGRFDRHKGADICIRAFAKVLEKRPSARLTVVGPDRGIIDDETGHVRHAEQWLRDEIRPSQLRSRISLPGQLSHAEIADLRRDAAATIVASRFETFSTVLIEAMAQGCPLVAARTGGIPEIIEHGQNGLLFAAEDVDDLAAKIVCLLDNRSLAATLGRNGIRDSLVRYNPLTVARQSLEFYEEVCTRNSACKSTNRTKVGAVVTGESVTG
jgi:glycosyltransferase involved in cell wall biosynthesis